MKIVSNIIIYLSILLSYAMGQVNMSLVTVPRPADVFVDGNKVGRSPIKQFKISPGEHEIQLIAKGYAPIIYPIIVNDSKAVKYEFFLNPIYDVKFKTSHEDLSFKMNNEHEWRKQKIKLQIEAGDHQLQVYRKGVLIDTRTITIDQPTTIRYHLNKKIENK